ncbi:unnamed protein product [Fusarium graminearum]|nr:unnamed protein product [Fusarium graminearum]
MEAEHINVLGGVKSPALFCAQTTGGDVPNLWKPSTVIRARCLANVHDFVKTILKSTLADWIKPNSHISISVIWVENGDSDVRFDMTDGVTWCMLGPDALSKPQSQPTAALGFRKWKKDDEKKDCDEEVVWTVQEIERTARHVWGHVLGLPHAYTTNGNWDIDEVSQLYIVNQLAGTRIYSLNGTDRLKSTSSIMHIDQSQDWSINPILRSANVLVDPESVNLLAELYKSPPVVDILEESIRSSPEWSQYTRTTKNLFYIDLKGGFKTNAHRIIGALTHFELGDNSKYQASACFDLAPGFKPAIGTVDAGYLIDEVKGRYACFDSSDNRIQIGWECMWNIRLKGKSGAWEAAAPGESFDQPCTFTTPFKAPPTVVAFIFRFSSQYTTSNPSLRISAGVGTTTTTGFTIRVNTFGGSMVDEIGAMWIAYEANDETIRSGYWNAMHLKTENNTVCNFSPPFSIKPRFLFYGFHHLDVPFGGTSAKAWCEATRWDEKGVSFTIKTPEVQHRAGISYIAFL